MNDPLFLLGSGFNRDAADEAGPNECESINIGKYEIDPRYPLVVDLWKICFPDETVIPFLSIEEQIQEHVSSGDMQPVKLLCSEIARCDYYLVPKLLQSESCYRHFFEGFPNSHFLTFNYDALVEIFLLRRGFWNPLDGYGMPVEVSPFRTDGTKVDPQQASRNQVIHFHGSICIYESAIDWDTSGGIPYLQLKDRPDFKFDPNSIAKLLYPYQKAPLSLGEDREIEHRVIAPVPDKATDLKSAFIKEMYQKAIQFISSSQRLICIGYDFNHNDLSSFKPILRVVESRAECQLTIVAPNADEIVDRVLKYFPEFKSRTSGIRKSFKQWAQHDFSIAR